MRNYQALLPSTAVRPELSRAQTEEMVWGGGLSVGQGSG